LYEGDSTKITKEEFLGKIGNKDEYSWMFDSDELKAKVEEAGVY